MHSLSRAHVAATDSDQDRRWCSYDKQLIGVELSGSVSFQGEGGGERPVAEAARLRHRKRRDSAAIEELFWMPMALSNTMYRSTPASIHEPVSVLLSDLGFPYHLVY